MEQWTIGIAGIFIGLLSSLIAWLFFKDSRQHNNAERLAREQSKINSDQNIAKAEAAWKTLIETKLSEIERQLEDIYQSEDAQKVHLHRLDIELGKQEESLKVMIEIKDTLKAMNVTLNTFTQLIAKHGVQIEMLEKSLLGHLHGQA